MDNKTVALMRTGIWNFWHRRFWRKITAAELGEKPSKKTVQKQQQMSGTALVNDPKQSILFYLHFMKTISHGHVLYLKFWGLCTHHFFPTYTALLKGLVPKALIRFKIFMFMAKFITSANCISTCVNMCQDTHHNPLSTCLTPFCHCKRPLCSGYILLYT